MQTSLNLLKHNTKHLVLAAAAVSALLMSGCASAVTGVSQTGFQPQSHADVIYVQPFLANADQVKLDGGMAQKLKSMASGESPASEQSQAARDASEQVANEVVRQLQAKGLNAVRADGPVPAGSNALIVAGDFQKIDEGKRRRRLLIGLGAGKSEVGASVRILYKPANGAPLPLQDFSASADSGHMPGVAETAGVGAVAGHVAVSAAAGAGVHGASEARRDSISADARRLGDAIARQVVAANTANGWMAAAQVE